MQRPFRISLNTEARNSVKLGICEFELYNGRPVDRIINPCKDCCVDSKFHLLSLDESAWSMSQIDWANATGPQMS
jgi:hypothetical protein